MHPDHSGVAAALAATARTLNETKALGETLQSITEAARASLPGFDHVSLTLVKNGRLETEVGTDDLVLRLDQVQYELEEGPCVDAARRVPIVSVSHLRNSQE